MPGAHVHSITIFSILCASSIPSARGAITVVRLRVSISYGLLISAQICIESGHSQTAITTVRKWIGGVCLKRVAGVRNLRAQLLELHSGTFCPCAPPLDERVCVWLWVCVRMQPSMSINSSAGVHHRRQPGNTARRGQVQSSGTRSTKYHHSV